MKQRFTKQNHIITGKVKIVTEPQNKKWLRKQKDRWKGEDIKKN